MSEIKLYRWWSEALKQYASGHLISYGTTADEARERILADLEKSLAEYFSYMFYPGVEFDEDELEDFDKWRKQIREDVARTPSEITQSVYIRGSE